MYPVTIGPKTKPRELKARFTPDITPRFFIPKSLAMIGVMRTLRDVARRTSEFAFVGQAVRTQAAAAIEKGVSCILKCQIVVDGERTVWCAQHDENTLVPAKARSYELPSLSGSESVGIVRFLMAVDDPAPEVVEAIQTAVAWFDKAKLEGIREIRKRDPTLPKGCFRPALWSKGSSATN